MALPTRASTDGHGSPKRVSGCTLAVIRENRASEHVFKHHIGVRFAGDEVTLVKNGTTCLNLAAFC